MHIVYHNRKRLSAVRRAKIIDAEVKTLSDTQQTGKRSYRRIKVLGEQLYVRLRGQYAIYQGAG